MIQRLIFTMMLIIASHAHALYPVPSAIDEALNDNLKFVGSFIPRYAEDGKMKMCVFRGQKTVVFMFYCTKANVPAESLRIHSVDLTQGSVGFYAETTAPDITKVKRDQYLEMNLGVWTFATDGFQFNWTISQFQKYDDTRSLNPSPSCISSQRYPKYCNTQFASEIDTWGNPALAHWQQPSDNWYALVTKMKSLVP